MNRTKKMLVNSVLGKILIALLLFVSLGIPSSTLAQTPELPEPGLQLRYLPAPDKHLVVDGVELGCYEALTFLEIIDLDLRAQYLDDSLKTAKKLLALERSNVQDKTILLDAANLQYSLLQEDRNRLLAKWTEENRKRHIAEQDTILDSLVFYSAIILGTIAVTEGIILYYTVD